MSDVADVLQWTVPGLKDGELEHFEAVALKRVYIGLYHNPALALSMTRTLTQRLRQADQRAILELNQKSEKLAHANRELTQQARYRSEFLTTVVHGLRTPLTSAGGYLTPVASSGMDGDQVEHAVNQALRNVKRIGSFQTMS